MKLGMDNTTHASTFGIKLLSNMPINLTIINLIKTHLYFLDQAIQVEDACDCTTTVQFSPC